MNTLANKNKIAIVVVGYNRLKSIQRLLKSLIDAQYPSNDIPLVISVDCSGCEELYDYVRNFYWPYGEKYVIIHEKRLGLKEHIFSCGDLTQYFKAIILLEDDLFASPCFYDYVAQTVEKYGDDERVAEISLYTNERNGYVGLPFSNLQNGLDVFLRQAVSSWGQCWTPAMWGAFRDWCRNNDTEEKIKQADMPSTIKGWDRAWSKYYYAYLLDTNRYVIYPNVSLTTNFSDVGEHSGVTNANEQVSLMFGNVKYRLGDFDKLVRYDIYFNNENLYEWLGVSRDELILDMYGFHEINLKKKYILTTLKLPYRKIKSFGLVLRPWELNVKYNIQGEGLSLYTIEGDLKTNFKRKYENSVPVYYVRDGNHELVSYVAMKNLLNEAKRISMRIKKRIWGILKNNKCIFL